MGYFCCLQNNWPLSLLKSLFWAYIRNFICLLKAYFLKKCMIYKQFWRGGAHNSFATVKFEKMGPFLLLTGQLDFSFAKKWPLIHEKRKVFQSSFVTTSFQKKINWLCYKQNNVTICQLKISPELRQEIHQSTRHMLLQRV